MDWIKLLKAIGITILIAVELGMMIAVLADDTEDDPRMICSIILIAEIIIIAFVAVVRFIYGILWKKVIQND